MENTTPLYNTYGDLYDAPQIVYSITVFTTDYYSIFYR